MVVMPRSLSPRAVATASGLGSVALVLAACGFDAGSTASAEAGGGGSTDRLEIVTSFYPLQYVVERIGGEAVKVTSLTKPGAEPHELELTPRDVAAVSDAPLLVYLAGLQSAVDTAVSDTATGTVVDVAPAARLDLEADVQAEDEEHAGGKEHAEGEEHAPGGRDLHFWLDPTRLSDVSQAVSERMSEASPEHAEDFASATKALVTDLERLDADFAAGLARCANRTLVTSHEAFGYLAQRYDLEQVGIAGLSPESEPDAGTLGEVADFVRAKDVRTIYYETLVSPAVAETVAAETGATTAVLDPVEGLTDASAGDDYLEVMRSNLASLRKGQPCP
jgi:zinc transport system substrate-binding protein